MHGTQRLWNTSHAVAAAWPQLLLPAPTRGAGSGLDTRPWSLVLGHDIHWFELDLPGMAAFKWRCMERAGMQAAWQAQGAAAAGGQPGRCAA